MPFVDVGDARLFYTDWPGGEPVVFAHAYGLDGDMWNHQLPALRAAGLRCVTYDRRGHGRSDRPGSGYDMDTLADDLGGLIERLDLWNATLVGHSMGTAEVVRYLTRHGPGRVARIVLSAPTTPFLLKTADNPEGIDEAVYAAGDAVMSRDVGRWLEGVSNGEYFAGEHDVSEAMGAWTRQRILDTPLPVLLATMDAFRRTDFRAELPKVEVPALVIQGGADTSMPVELTGRKTAPLIPDNRLVVIEGAGHGLYLSEALRYNAALLDFITGGKDE